MLKEIKGIDISYLEEIANGDEEFIQDMINLFAEQAPEDLKGIEGGIGQENWEAIYQSAHKLKYAIGSLGREDLKTMLDQIEDLCKEKSSLPKIQEDFSFIKTEINQILSQL